MTRDEKIQYYDMEERRGRQRLNRFILESSDNVVDLEVFILPKAFIVGGDRNLKRVYNHYLRNGYTFYGKKRRTNGY